MISNSVTRYGLITQILHWLMALIIISMIGLGIFMDNLPQNGTEEISSKFWFYSLHKTLGIAALIIAVIRVVWALVQSKPKALDNHSATEQFTARFIHALLYGLMIIMPVSGWLHHAALDGYAPIWWPFSQNLPFVPKDEHIAGIFGSIHDISANLLILSVVLHVAGAVKHAVVDRDDTLRRMIPGLHRGSHSANGSNSPHDGDKKQRALFLHPSVLATIILLAVVITASILPDQPDQTDTRQIAAATDIGSDAKALNSGDADNWSVHHENSNLSVSLIQSGKPVNGLFRRWQAEIRFDPDNLAASNIDVVIDIMSLELGSVSNQAVSADFLNAEQFPRARFVSEQISRTGPNTFEATGSLTIAGQTQPIKLPFELEIRDNQTIVKGNLTLNRLSFGIGKKGFPNGKMVGLDIQVSFEIEATRTSGEKLKQPNSS